MGNFQVNLLEQCITAKGWNEIQCMNALQEAGIVSDLCVSAAHVADKDCTEAIWFLTLRSLKLRDHPPAKAPGPAPKPAPVEAQKELFTRHPHSDP